jgi:hypothetical protein
MTLIKQRVVYLNNFDFEHLSLIEVEIVALNLRKMAEAIALGCVVAADYHFGTFRKDGYEADKLISRALRKDERCFPRPIHLKLDLKTRMHTADFVQGNIVGPEKIKAIYRDLGNILHEHNPFREVKDQGHWIPRLKDYRDAIKALVWVHVIPLLPGKTFAVAFGEEDENAPKTMSLTHPPADRELSRITREKE